MSLNAASSLLPIFEIGSAFIALGMVCYLTYNIIIGMYCNDKYIKAIKYCFTFAAGYFIFKFLIGNEVTISLKESEIKKYPYITVVGSWAFVFDQVASIAKTFSSTLSTSVAAPVTSTFAIVYAGMALHIKLSMNAWRGIPEVFEAFVYGVISYFCLSHFDLFYNGMTLFFDSIINSFFKYDIYESYSVGLTPILRSAVKFLENLNSFSISGAFTNTLSIIITGITLLFLFIMDTVNLLLFFLQHIGILLLPIFTIAISFFSGIDPTRPLKLAGAFAILTVLAKLQVMIMNLIIYSFENIDSEFDESLKLLNLGISILDGNFLFIIKFCFVFICTIILIIIISTKFLDQIFGIVTQSQMIPFFQHTKLVFGKFRRK
jgi:hypothetical protein